VSKKNFVSSVILDIESTALYADLGVVLCMSYESSEDPGKVHTLRTDRLNPTDWKKGIRGNDREMVKQANEVIRSHDIVIAHNGRFFDVPFLRTRAMVHRLSPLHSMVIVDPVLVARRHLRFERNSLSRLLDTLGLKDKKTPLDLSVWTDVILNGSKEGMDNIVEHCEADVKALSGLLPFVRPFIKQFDMGGSDR
jgi:uncharacterized protein YprB with RNaseH-like and TPR domain